MTKSRLLSLGLIGVLLIGLLMATGCFAPSSTSGGTTTGGGFDWTIIIFLVVIFGLMYLLMIRPQRSRQKKQQQMMSELQKGDEIITNSGIYGRIESVEENSFVIRLESGATMRIVRSAVAGKKPEG